MNRLFNLKWFTSEEHYNVSYLSEDRRH